MSASFAVHTSATPKEQRAMAHLMISVLGPLHISLTDAPAPRFESDKVRALLIYLAVNAARAHRRETLADLLWPELAGRAARHNLSQALFNLRQAIGDQRADPPFLLVMRDAVQFNADSDYRLDAAMFTAMLAACATHPHRSLETCWACAQRLADALALYRGDFLAQFSRADSVPFEEWALLEREQFQRRALNALAVLAAYHERRGDYAQSCACARRQLELDPWHEAAHRHLMRVLALDGQRTAALVQYERCRQALAEGLGVEPEEETTVLYRRIRDDKVTRWQGDAATNSPAHPFTHSPLHNFPQQPTPFIGREAELAQLADMLATPTCRLLTIVGPGGVGKTRLALQAAAEQIDMVADGVYFVPLAALASSEHIAAAVMNALDLRSAGNEPLEDQLITGLHGKELLLVLDNFEHLLDDLDLVTNILHRAPGVTIIATSRERLNVRGEWILELGGLAVPPDEHAAARASYSAVELFVQSVRRVRAGFRLTSDDMRAVIRICQLVEGLPLAIELATTWTRALTCAEIAHEIDQNIEFLATSLRDVPKRHRSLRAVFDHSWQLLTGEERRALRQISTFHGGFRRAAAEQVAGASLTHLAALIDKSLLRQSISGRYDLHELVRQYAGMQLRATDEERAARDRHLDYFLALAEHAAPQLTGTEQEAALAQLEEERDNLRAAFRWALQQDDLEAAARFGAALWRFWWMHGHQTDVRWWMAHVLPNHNRAPAAATAHMLYTAGTLNFAQGNCPAAIAFFEQSLPLYRALDNPPRLAATLVNLATLLSGQGDHGRAATFAQESLELHRALGDTHGVALALGALGDNAFHQGDYPLAQTHYEASLALARQLGDTYDVAIYLHNLGEIIRYQGNYVQSAACHEESLALFRALEVQHGIGRALHSLALIRRHAGDDAAARTRHMESLDIARQLEDSHQIGLNLAGLAAIAADQQRFIRATRLLGAADALLAASNTPLSAPERADLDGTAADVQQHLDAAEWEKVWAEGHAMTTEQALACALERCD